MKEVIINFQSEILNLESINPLISRYKLFIAYPSEPAKGYIFSKEVLSKLSNSIRGCPVVAGFMNNKDGSLLGGHESDLALNENNQVIRTPAPIPIGFADYSVDCWFEEYKGRQYLTTYIYIWDGRFPELSNLSERNIYQSMEVIVDDEKDGQYKIVKEAYALGLCLLENVNPAFENSTIQKFTFSNIDNEISLLKQEYEQIINQQNQQEKIITQQDNFSEENIINNETSIEIDNSSESFNIKNFNKEGDEVIKEAVEKFSLNSDQIREILKNGLSEFKYNCGDYECSKYYVDCYDAEYVYVWDNEDDKTYRMTYDIAEMVATINIESKEEVIRGNYVPVSQTNQENEQMSEEFTTEEMSTEEEMAKKNCSENEEEMSSNEFVDNTAMQELNDKAAEENKELSEEQMGEENDKEKMIASLKEEMSVMQEKMSKLESDLTSFSEENTKLKEFKASIEKQNKNFEIETTLKEVVGVLPKEDIDAFRTSSENFSLENIDAWKNEVKAKAFNFSKNIEKKPFIQVGLPVSDKPKRGTGLWD